MKYWWDGKDNSTRLRNVNFCWAQLKILREFLHKNDVTVDCKMYDFSPTKNIKDAIHIPYPLGIYNRSEKINKILKLLSTDKYEYIVLLDADLFLDPHDYMTFKSVLTSINKESVAVFDLAKLNDIDTVNIVNGTITDFKSLDFSYAWSGSKAKGPLHNRLSGFGGMYIAPIDLLLQAGGYDEKFTGWGGEDGELLDRLVHGPRPVLKRGNIHPVRNMAPYHLSHLRDYENKHYAKRNKR